MSISRLFCDPGCVVQLIGEIGVIFPVGWTSQSTRWDGSGRCWVGMVS